MLICELVNFREKTVSGNKDDKVVNSSGWHSNLNIYIPNNRTQKWIKRKLKREKDSSIIIVRDFNTLSKWLAE